ncbi:MAG: class I SAM-dependent methyltransferase [Solirubrobacteraceae bacterium]
MTNTIEVFERHAGQYEAQRRRLIPPYDAFYGTALDALGLAAAPPRRVLDLGAGTGLLARMVLARHPEARVTLLDGAPAMLDEARATIGEDAGYVVADLVDELPAGEWDAVVSALAIHHLADDAKADLYARIHAALVPGGVFVNAEQVAAPTARLEAANAAWHARRAAEAGSGEQEWAGAVERMRQDRTATVEQQLGWLRDAGFADADCLFKDHCFAVLAARRAG